MAVSYFWPPEALTDSHSVTLVEWDGGLLVPQIFHPSAYTFDGNVSGLVSETIVTDTGVSGIGFVGAGEDSSGKTWLLRAYGDVCYITDAASDGYLTLPNSVSGLTFVGMGIRGGFPYFVSVSGTVLTVESGAVVNTGSALNAHVSSISSDGTSLYAVLPDSANLATLTFSNQTSWSSALASTPMQTPTFVSASVSGVIVGGWNASALPESCANLDVNSSFTEAVAADTTGNSILLLTGVEPVWTVSNRTAGSGSPTKAVWASSGEQVIAVDPTNDIVQVFNVTSGALTSFAELSISGVTDICVNTSGLNAYLAQPSQNEVTVLYNSVNVWSVDQSVHSMTAPSSVIVSGQQVIVGSSGAVNWLSESSNVWGVETTVSGLGFTVTGLAEDTSSIVYAVGNNGSLGELCAVNIAGVVASTSWTGSADAVFWLQDQIAVADKTNSLIRVFSLMGSTLTQENTASAPSGVAGFGYTDPSVWLCGSDSLAQMVFTAPYFLAPQASGVVSVYRSAGNIANDDPFNYQFTSSFGAGSVSGEASWGTTNLGVGHVPTAGAWDVSGTVWVATEQDDLYNVGVSGGVIFETPMTPIAISPKGLFPPLGISSMLWWNDGLYGVSSVNQALMLVSGAYFGGPPPGGGPQPPPPPPPPPAPLPPTNLSTQVISMTSFSVSWTASTSSPAPKYSLYYASTNTFIGSTVGTSYTISGLQGGKTYSVYIVDQNSNGVSAPSVTVSATLPANNYTAPTKPTNVVVTE